MASRAGGWESECDVRRIGGGVEIGDMAIVAIGAGIGISLGVTTVASDCGMPAMQRKCLGMLISSALPARRNRQMARLAVAAESGLDMVWIDG